MFLRKHIFKGSYTTKVTVSTLLLSLIHTWRKSVVIGCSIRSFEFHFVDSFGPKGIPAGNSMTSLSIDREV